MMKMERLVSHLNRESIAKDKIRITPYHLGCPPFTDPKFNKFGQREVTAELSFYQCPVERAVKLVQTLSLFSHIQPLQYRGLNPIRLFCPWNFTGKKTEAGCHFLLQRIFLTQGSILCLSHLLRWQVDFYNCATGKLV